MKRSVYQNVQFGVGDIKIDGENGKLLQFFDPKTEEYVEFPMADEDAKHIARLLTGAAGIVIPTDEDKKTYGPGYPD